MRRRHQRRGFWTGLVAGLAGGIAAALTLRKVRGPFGRLAQKAGIKGHKQSYQIVAELHSRPAAESRAK